MEPKNMLLAHMEDIAKRAAKTGCAASRFLTPAEAQSVAARFQNRRDVTLTFDGGFEGAERVRAVFLNPDWGVADREELFAALKIEAREQPAHRDILGALMALGIERETVGDILPGALICLPEMRGFIAQTLERVGRFPVTLTEIRLDELPAKEESLQIKTDTVASLRLDAALGASFGLSRGAAVLLIEAGRVSLNHEECLLPAKEIREGALLSVRGMGRAKLLEVGGVSKKGRIFVKFGLFR